MDTKLRLFIAIQLPDTVRAGLEERAALLRHACVRGSFPPPENLHLTLVFLGDVFAERVPAVVAAMDAAAAGPVPLELGPLDRFRSRDGDVLVRQVRADAELYDLQRRLEDALRADGFRLETQPYRPHLTLARRAVLRDGETPEALSAQLPPLSFTAWHMTLFCSEQLRGRRVYTPLHRTALVPRPS